MWSLEDGSHRGRVMALLPDGEHDVEQTETDGWLDRYVLGWVVRCDCGWSTPAWTRVDEPWDTDVAHRMLYSPQGVADSTTIRDTLRLVWRSHVRRRISLQELRTHVREQRAAQQRVDDAVAEARAGGASWAEIGREASVTRQSAHQRWGKQED